MFRLSLILLLLPLSVLSHPGTGLVEDSQGNIYYTDLVQVWKVSANGTRTVAVPGVHTHELYLDGQDNLYGEHLWYNGDAEDTWGHYAWKLSATGTFEKVVPDREGFLEDYSFVRDHFGRMYWADRAQPCQHVVRKNPDGSRTSLGNECLKNIRWMTSTENGIVFLIDDQDLKKVNTQGKVETIAKSIAQPKLSQVTTSEQHYLAGVTVDREGNIYVADFSAREVKRFGRDGESTVVYTSAIPWSPTALLVASNGDYVVTETSLTNEVRLVRKKKSTHD